MKKRVLYREIAYVLGITLMAFGASCMQRADFGMSMVIAPAYLLHVKLVETFSFFSFGVGATVYQGLLLVFMCLLLRRFRASYLLSFVTAMFYGVVLDGMVWLVGHIPATLVLRAVLYVAGMVITAAGVAFCFRTYIAPEVYELFVKAVSERYGFTIHRFKTAYDLGSVVLSVILSFAFFGFGKFVGVSWGTVVCAFVNGPLVGFFIKLYDRTCEYKDRFPTLCRFMP